MPLKCFSVQNIPFSSPARSMPLFSIRPKSCQYFQVVSAPIRSAMSIRATLQEFITALVSVWSPWPPFLWQWMGSPPTILLPPQEKWSSREMIPSSKPMATVTGLNTDPGS